MPELSSISEKAQMSFRPEAVKANPLWVDLVQEHEAGDGSRKTLINELISLTDARLPLYFRPNKSGVQ